MTSARNRMYVEGHNKRPNCGILLYEQPANGDAANVVSNSCSALCVSWEQERNAQRQAEVVA